MKKGDRHKLQGNLSDEHVYSWWEIMLTTCEQAMVFQRFCEWEDDNVVVDTLLQMAMTYGEEVDVQMK